MFRIILFAILWNSIFGRMSLDFWTKPKFAKNCEGDCGEMRLLKDRNGNWGDRNDYKVEGIGKFPSFAGFALVRPETNNNLFWWYFPAQNGDKNAPLLLWLQGGPGGASLFGLFSEMGPLELKSPLGPATQRPTHWNKEYAMIFIDNPVGAGFSFTTEDAGYATNTKVDVAKDLWVCMLQFYTIFDDVAANDFYITGESYGGHYVPAFGAYIHAMNQQAGDRKINLKGVAIGDGWIDPVNQVKGYADLVFNFGLASVSEKEVVQEYVDRIEGAILLGDTTSAFNIWDEMLNGDIYPYANYFHNITGSNDYDNVLRINAPESFEYYSSFVNQASVRKAIHVGNATLNDGSQCEKHLVPDVMRSLKSELAILMENYKVLVYSGALDIIIGAALTELFLPTIEWSGSEEFIASKKIIWSVNSEIAGYVNSVRNFTYVIVRNGGHILPYDQPENCLDMIDRFVKGKSFN